LRVPLPRVTIPCVFTIKIAVPNMACKVIDWAIQAFGGGTSNDFGLAAAYATARLLRLADGPDEVHRDQLARLELARSAGRNDAVDVGNWQRALNNKALGTSVSRLDLKRAVHHLEEGPLL
jgi:acyl-CoA dehydrogenase